MKRYMFTVLLVLSVGIALPHMWKKIIESNGELTAKLEEILPGAPETPEEDGLPTGEMPSGAEGEPAQPADETSEAEEFTFPTDSASETEDVLPEWEELDLPTEEGTEGTLSEKSFVTVDRTYWDDALFIGDSRTVGLSEYADLGGADVFATSGMSVYKVFSEKVSMSDGKHTLEEMLTAKQYGKIYIMMGINELGYDHKSTVKKFQAMMDRVQELQPNAILFLGANLHVTEKKSSSDKIYNNEAINRLNQAFQEMADNKTKFYVDVNELFDDGKGNLDASYTVDEAHVLGKYYAQWADWLLTKGI